MKGMNGLHINSEHSSQKNDAIEFIVIKEEKEVAIESIMNLIDAGNIITLCDNRDRREGSVSIKKVNDVYLQSGGGHGFSTNWKTSDEKNIKWLIKVTVPFNTGDQVGNNGKISKSS